MAAVADSPPSRKKARKETSAATAASLAARRMKASASMVSNGYVVRREVCRSEAKEVESLINVQDLDFKTLRRVPAASPNPSDLSNTREFIVVNDIKSRDTRAGLFAIAEKCAAYINDKLGPEDFVGGKLLLCPSSVTLIRSFKGTNQ